MILFQNWISTDEGSRVVLPGLRCQGFSNMAHLFRTLWFCVLISHVALTAAWWWAMPAGFPVGDINFWANQVFPLGVIVVGLSCRLLSKNHPHLSAALGVCFPVMWLSSGIAALVVFPKSISVVWIAPFAFGMGLTILHRFITPAAYRYNASVFTAVVFSICLGIWLPFTQRSKDPDTLPLNTPFQTAITSATDYHTVPITSEIRVRPDTGEISIEAGFNRLNLQPNLRFVSRSPDRGWTLFAKEADREGPVTNLSGVSHDPDSDSLTLGYQQDFETSLSVTSEADSTVTVESTSLLSKPVYSHLNTFTELSLTGHRKLSVEFSACPGRKIDFTYSDYPRGKPARFAYLHRDGSFRVVEASSAEKGPFHDLATGRLARGETLVMTFFDDDRPIYRVSLEDWSAQAGVQDSPTAGYGVPVNAIEFSLGERSANSPASMFITLAATGVGRGFQSVGHAAGTYRNRMKVETLPR